MAYLLVAHGSRDRRYGVAFDELAARVSSRLIAAKSLTHSQPIPAIGIATLECSAIPLHQQIERFALEMVGEEGDRPLHLLPLFLLPGSHALEDIPAEVAQARQRLGQTVMLHLHPYLGSDPRMVNLLGDRMTATSVEAWIFVNHGTRSSAGEIFTEQLTATLARRLQVPVIPASWSVAPGLSDRARTLIERGHQRIGIFSYFLFPGGIPDALDQAVDALTQAYPTVQFSPTPPLSVGEGLVNLLQAIVSWEMHLPGQAIAP